MKVVKSSLLAVICMCLAVSVFAQNPVNVDEAKAAGKADYVKIYDAGGDYKVDLPYDCSFYTSRTLLAAYISGINEAKKQKNNAVRPANAIRMYVFNKLVDPNTKTNLNERLTRLSAEATWELLLPAGETIITSETKPNVKAFADAYQAKYKDNKNYQGFISQARKHGLLPLSQTAVERSVGKVFSNLGDFLTMTDGVLRTNF